MARGPVGSTSVSAPSAQLQMQNKSKKRKWVAQAEQIAGFLFCVLRFGSVARNLHYSKVCTA